MSIGMVRPGAKFGEYAFVFVGVIGRGVLDWAMPQKQAMADNGRWRGGRTTNHGYVRLKAPGHARASQNGYVFEHILVAERATGKPLPLRAKIHHIDGNKANNAPANLVVCEDQAYHTLLHRRQRAYEACGDANARRCSLCAGYDRQTDIAVYGAWPVHRSCHADRQRRRRAS